MSPGCSRRRWTGRNSAKACWKRSTQGSSRSASTAPMSELQRFFDGKVAKPHAVRLVIGTAGIEICDEGNATIALWPLARVRVADQNAVSGAFTLRLEPDDAARLEVSSGPQLQALL